MPKPKMEGIQIAVKIGPTIDPDAVLDAIVAGVNGVAVVVQLEG